MKVVIAIIIFSAIILFHELGHFLLAKKNGIEVVEFSLGMGPRLLSTVKGGTRYSLKVLPLGGSCMMLGEDDEDKRPGTFNSAGVWSRFSVIAAGPIFNFILAFVFSVIIVALIGYTPASVAAVQEDSSAAESGLKEGDLIKKFDGYHIDIREDLSTYIAVMGVPEDKVDLVVERDGKDIDISYKPEVTQTYLMGFNRASTDPDDPVEVGSLIKGMPLEEKGVVAGDIITSINGVKIENGADYTAYIQENPLSQEAVEITYEHRGTSHKISIVPESYSNVSLGFQYQVMREKGSSVQTLKYAALEVKYWIRTTLLSLKELVTGHYGIKDLSGPVGVVDVIGDTYEQSKADGALWVWVNMLNMAVLLSANLGVMNLLPIPALDGGRLIFIIVEAIIRRPLNRQVEGMIHFAGMVLLMLLMAVVMYNDVLRLF